MAFIDITALLFAIGVGFGVSCWLFGTLLEKSNNIGDSRGNKYEYHAFVNYTCRREKLSDSERNSFTATHAENIDAGTSGPKGSDLARRMTPEELAAYKKNNVPRGAYQSDSSHINRKEDVDEFEEWEKREGFSRDLRGVFKPLEDDPNP